MKLASLEEGDFKHIDLIIKAKRNILKSSEWHPLNFLVEQA